jgi:hypothetical protein
MRSGAVGNSSDSGTRAEVRGRLRTHSSRFGKASVTLCGTIYRAVAVGSDDSSPEIARGWI